MPTPVLLADPHRDIAPHSYVVQVNSSLCSNCGHLGRSCETYAKTHLKANWDRKYITNFRPLTEAPRYNLPIEILHAPQRTIPFCSQCPNPLDVVSKLPYPPTDEPKAHLGSGFTAQAAPKAPASTAPKKPKVTTDDLMSDLDL